MHDNGTISHHARSPARAPLALALVAALGLVPLVASAATVTVTSPGDSDPTATSTCTLRQAIITMNHGSSGGVKEGNCRTGATASGAFASNDTIVFDTGAFPADGSSTITLTLGRGQLAISDAVLTIDASANGQVTIDANHASRVVDDSAAAGASLTLKHLTLTHGNVTTTDCDGYSAGGGLCSVNANLTLANSTVSGNAASQAGGGIFTGGGSGGSGGSVTLTNSTVSDNSAGIGGGIATLAGGITLTNSTLSGNVAEHTGGGILTTGCRVTLVNSTVYGNTAGEAGGGIARDGAVCSAGSVTLTNSTVSGNTAMEYAGIAPAGAVTINNSIVTDNAGGNIAPAATLSGSHNLIGGAANLGPLRDNGGPTRTLMPQAGSPAIDAGGASVCALIDQRGVARPQGAACDIGAVEVVSVGSLVAVTGSGQSASIWRGFFNPLAVQVLGPMGRAAPYVTLHATPAIAGQPGASCGDATTNGTGQAYLYCRANGVAGSYDVTVHAAGSPGAAPVVFVLHNQADGDTIFRDGFDPPGPRTLMLTAASGGEFAIDVPGNLPAGVAVPLEIVIDKHHQPLARVDALRRGGATLLRISRYTDADHGRHALPGHWHAASAQPKLHMRRTNHGVVASLR